MDTISALNVHTICIDTLEYFTNANPNVAMLRLDTIHPLVSGNKWFKLKYNIQKVQKDSYVGMLSFGGAFSNHLIALAAAGTLYHLPTIGIVRGEELHANSNHVLKQCADLGMQFEFISRSQYHNKNDHVFLETLEQKYPNYWVVPEGGANDLGMRGASEIMDYIPENYNYIVTAVGSATTFIGLLKRLKNHQKLIGICPMKGGAYLKEIIEVNVQGGQQWELLDRFHDGGFGKISLRLENFMHSFYKKYGILLDRVYTAKMMWAVHQLLFENYFDKEASILCIHSGGLTGN